MPITKSAFGLHLVSHGISSAQIHLTATVTINAQNGEVMNIDSVSAYQSGFAINFTSWETTSISASKNSPSNGYVNLSVSGRITFTWTDQNGIAYSNTTNENFSVTLNYN